MKTMRKNLFRLFALSVVAISLGFAAAVRPVEATCGGGGGGGMGGGEGSSSSSDKGGKGEPTYATNWVTTLAEATNKATPMRKAVLIYFAPEGEKGSHPFFRTKMMFEISEEHAAVRFIYAKDHPLREEYRVPKNLHVLHVCDWHANSLKVFTATSTSKFPYPSIDVLLKTLQKTVDGVLKKLETNLKNAEAKLEKDDVIEALKALGDLVNLKGHDLAAKAKPAIKKIEEAATKEIEAAVKIEVKKARAKELKKIKDRFKNLKSVEDRCDKEIEAATGMAPAREEGSSLVRGELGEAADALLDSIDFSKRATSITERAYQAMVDGL
ncbi:MAG TPA: hypothetical protein VFS19_01555, partial [Planctomycetota bacterium]|nr:hypothetical protein [Planctomycetota bacterium]